MRVLLVYPEFPDTYWSFRHALSFEGWIEPGASIQFAQVGKREVADLALAVGRALYVVVVHEDEHAVLAAANVQFQAEAKLDARREAGARVLRRVPHETAMADDPRRIGADGDER